MGNCFTKIKPPECRHERLNEHNDHYFAKVQARNSLQSKRRWWKRKEVTEEQQQHHWEVPTLTDPCVTSEPEEETSLMVTTSSGDINAFFPQPSFVVSPSARRKRRRPKADAAVDGWQVKRKGKALQLRLANNRFLQLAASSALLSPITLDSAVKSAARTFNPLESSRGKEKLNSEFESSMSKGMVWVEVAHRVQVTATAMSRKSEGDEKYPLLLAVGSEDGVVTLTEILDEHHPTGVGRGDQTLASEDSSLRKFGEKLEFPHQGRIRSLDFSPDGQYLVIGGDGCKAVLLHIILHPYTRTLQDLKVLQQVERVDRVYAVQFSPNSEQIAIGGFDGKVAFSSVSSLLSDESHSLVEISRSGLIFCLDWSPDGMFIAIGGSDKQCAIVDSSYKLVHETLRSTSIQTLKWSHDGTHLAIGDREVAILDGGTFDIKCEISNTPTSSPGASRYRISSLCWSPDGTFLAVGGSDGICLVVETKGYALVHEVRRSGSILCLAWGQQKMVNGEYRRYLALSDDSCNVTLLKAGADIEGYVSESDDLSSAASSSYFSTGSDWVLREDCFRDIEDSTPEPREIKPQGNVTSVAFSRSDKSKNSSYLAYAADDCSLTIMTTRDWKAVFQMEFAKPIRTLMFSSSSNYLALGGDEGVLYVLSVPSRSMILNTIFSSPIQSVAFSKHDERLAIGSSDGILTLLCPDADWEPIGEIEDSESPILAQDWCSKNLAVGREDGSVAIFDTEKVFSNFFVPVAEFSNSLPVRSVAFGASGRFLVIGGESGVISILSAKGGWVLCNQIKMGCSILTTKWSPAGRYLAFAGTNQTCRIMDTITWVEVGEIHGALSSVFETGSSKALSCIDWSIDGKWVALGSTGGGIHVLSTSGWQLLAPSLDGLSLSSNGIAAK